MPRSHLIAFCLAVVGAYGGLYAIHAARSTAGPIYDLESRLDESESKVNDLENEIESLKSAVENFELQQGVNQ